MMQKVIALITIEIALAISQNFWIETNQGDFNDGMYECNLFSSWRDGGAVEFIPKWDLNGDAYIDLVVINEFNGVSYIYWGDASGYSASRRTDYQTSGGNTDAGDFNLDNYPELFVAGSGNAYIYWGTPSGPDPGNYTALPASGTEACFIADYNKDGYFDFIVGQYSSGNAGIYWGSATGFSSSNVTLLPSYSQHNIETGDFDKNGWPDILFNQQNSINSVVYWGSSSGFNTSTTIPNPASNNTHGSSVADLDRDNNLDIILTCFAGGTSLYIYRGSGQSFTLWQTLNPGPCYGGSSCADFNNDGFLDILCMRGYGVQQRPLIYWGSATGYSEPNKAEIGELVDASGCLIADFNNDTIPDVFVDNYAWPAQSSYILLSPGYTVNYSLPTVRDHHSRFREIGNVYDRKYREDYVSSVFDADSMVAWGVIEWDDSLPPGSNVLMYVRSGDVPVPDTSWNGWDSVGQGADIVDSLNSRYFQYRARLTYTNPAHLPYLFEVRIEYGQNIAIIVEPDQADSTMPAMPVAYDLNVINVNVGRDTVDLGLQHNTSWQITLYDSTGVNPLVDHNGNSFVDVIMDSNETIRIVAEVLPPVSAQGGDVDSLIVTGYSTAMPGLQDDALLVTTIRSIVSILVEPDQTDSTLAGVPVSYHLWVYNEGTFRDTVDLYYSHNTAWGIALLDSTGTVPLIDHNSNGIPDIWVNSNDSVGIMVVVYPSASAMPGDIDTLVLTGRSSRNPLVMDNATLLTRIVGDFASILVEPDQSGYALPGIEERYDLYVINYGSRVDTVDLHYVHNQVWPVVLYDSLNNLLIDHNSNGFVDVITPMNDSTRVILGLTPDTVASGTEDSLWLIGTSNINGQVRDSAFILTTVGLTGTIIVFPDQVNNGLPGSWVSFDLTCQNNQNFVDTIDVTAQEQQGWSFSFLDSLGSPLSDHNGNSLVDIPEIAGLGGEADFSLRVLIPASAPYGSVDSIIVYGYSGRDSTVHDSAILVLTVSSYAQVLIMPDQSDSANCGDTLDYALYVQNLGNMGDVIDLTLLGGNFIYTLRDMVGNLLTDTDSDGMVDVGLVPPFGGGESLLVRVYVPVVGAGVDDTVVVRAHSSNNVLVYDDAQLVTKVRGGIWSLVLEPDQEQAVEVGRAVVFDVGALLHGNVADVVDLGLTGVSAGWSVTLADSTDMVLTDTDSDGSLDLGPVSPEQVCGFKVRVAAPQQFDLAGVVESLGVCDFYVRGRCSLREDIADSAHLRAFLVPGFDVHNYRNPFHGQTQFIFSLPKDGRVTLEVYNRAGERVRSLLSGTAYVFGVHTYPWDGRNDAGRDLAPGTYIYIMNFDANDGEHMVAKKKAVILR